MHVIKEIYVDWQNESFGSFMHRILLVEMYTCGNVHSGNAEQCLSSHIASSAS